MLFYLRKPQLLLFCLVLLLISACKKRDTLNFAQKNGLRLSVDSKFGAILTDINGRSLYMFSSDVTGTANCIGVCETTWPPFYSANISTNPNLNSSEIGVIIRADGRKQNTYKGYPLYYYKNDVRAGQINGDGIAGLWFVAKPDYSLMLANHQLTGLDDKNYLSTYVEGIGKTVYLTDDKGRTLYAFVSDKHNKNIYTNEVIKNDFWPVYEGEIKSLPSAINKDLVAIVDVKILGKKQMTFKGWPLYYYYKDLQRGHNKSITIGPTPGAFWPVLTLEKPTAPL